MDGAVVLMVSSDYQAALDAYYRGDYAAAYSGWLPFAEQGDARAQAMLGIMYANGEGVSENTAKAADWYKKAAELGSATAQNNLGNMYYIGKGVPEDYAIAAYWRQKAAEQGFVNSQASLGAMYALGEGVPEDYVKAFAWLNLAAVEGHREIKETVRKYMTPTQIAEAQKLSAKLYEEIQERKK